MFYEKLFYYFIYICFNLWRIYLASMKRNDFI